MENFHDGGGDETVPEQAGVHEIVRGDPPSQTIADVNGDGDPEHSNVHVGELHWRTDPTDSADEPDTPLEIEVDYVAFSIEELSTINFNNIDTKDQ